MNNLIKSLVIFFAIMLYVCTAMASSKAPVAMLLQPQGQVEYSKDGQKWKKVKRNKFLFEGYRVKTGADARCKLINQQTNLITKMGINSEVEIHADGIKAISGNLIESSSEVNLLAGLKRMFAKAQKYTVVRRAAKKKGKIKLITIKNITLSDDYPDLVWKNLGSEYSYRLIIDNRVFDVQPSSDDMVRFKLNQMKPGEFNYTVQVIKDGKIVYSPEKKRSLKWMSDNEKKDFKKGKNAINQLGAENSFLIGYYMETYELTVAAMDQYRQFFSENPDENEMRPFLIKVYNDLKLTNLKKEETDRYNNK
ncbi:Secreted protein [Candidatus Magnetomoraceae bacterium gMMP-15]